MKRCKGILPSTLLPLLAVLFLVSCSTTPLTNVSIPNNSAINATNTPTPDQGDAVTSLNTCPEALALIAQNQVASIKISKELSNQGKDIIVMISLFLRSSQQGSTGLAPTNERDLLTSSSLYAQCRTEILDAVNQLNKKLPKDQQVQVNEVYIPAS